MLSVTFSNVFMLSMLRLSVWPRPLPPDRHGGVGGRHAKMGIYANARLKKNTCLMPSRLILITKELKDFLSIERFSLWKLLATWRHRWWQRAWHSSNIHLASVSDQLLQDTDLNHSLCKYSMAILCPCAQVTTLGLSSHIQWTILMDYSVL